MATIQHRSNLHPDGTLLGQSAADLIGFHGATPSDQYALVTNATGTLGNTNAAVSAIICLLQEKGLMATA